MTDISFVRNEMLPPREPPASGRGVIGWLRENLFSSWMNAILTVLGVLAVYFLIMGSLPWLLHSVWNANSQLECYAAVTAKWGEGASGACWAIIRERWNQFLYGFYPRDLYWRPTTALALMFVALAPVLYFGLRRINVIMVGSVTVLLLLALYGIETDGWHILLTAVVFALLTGLAAVAPKKLVWVTVAFPFVGLWLLWGGSVWGPVGAAFGFVILGAVWFLLQRFVGVVVAAGIGVVVAAVWWLSLQGYITGALSDALPFRLDPISSDKFGGFLLAFVIGVTAISASLPMGILLALGRRSDMPLVKGLSVGFIEFIRGVPLITLLFTASLLLQYFLPPQTNFDLILRVIILVTFFSAAYIAEVIRGGLAALPRGQYEAADALGLDYWQAQRLIIMPQALKISIPGIVSSFIGLFKDTTLVSLVGLADPLVGITRVVRSDIAWKGIYWEPLLFVAAIFFVVCFGMSRYSMYLERKLKTDHR
jgi:general L-amino acid transport system permease protein